MSGTTKIEWTDKSWNPIRGCTRVSAGCKNCYAERQAIRQKNGAYHGLVRSTTSGPRWTGEVRVVESELDSPLHWRRPQMVFVNSMSDLFHGDLPTSAIDRIMRTMLACPQHTFQILTKRADRMVSYIREYAASGVDLARDHPNIWFGVSVENADNVHRAEAIKDLPVAVRWLSCEPLLGPVDLQHVLGEDAINWIVTGGESGPGARPMDQDWVWDIRDQCVEKGVPFFHKQNGGVFKKAAGRLLDGRVWDDLPAGHIAALPEARSDDGGVRKAV